MKTVQIGNIVFKRVEVQIQGNQLTLSHPSFIDLKFVDPEVGVIMVYEKEGTNEVTLYGDCTFLNSGFSGMEMIFTSNNLRPVAEPSKCTAKVYNNNGYITTESCVSKSKLIDKRSSSDGERDYYSCPDCGKEIVIDYNENGWY
jgi:hypothetical protein